VLSRIIDISPPMPLRSMTVGVVREARCLIDTVTATLEELTLHIYLHSVAGDVTAGLTRCVSLRRLRLMFAGEIPCSNDWHEILSSIPLSSRIFTLEVDLGTHDSMDVDWKRVDRIVAQAQFARLKRSSMRYMWYKKADSLNVWKERITHCFRRRAVVVCVCNTR